MLCGSCQMCERISMIKYNRIMKKLNELYDAPCMEIIDMQVEQCILTGSYGAPGEPGQDSGYNDFDGDL